MSTSPGDLFKSGNLADAITAAIALVRDTPGDAATRSLLAQMFCFAGDFERADKHLDLLIDQKPDFAYTANIMRQCMRGETARLQFFREGRLPEFVEKPTPTVELLLRLSIALREGDRAAAAVLSEQAENARPALPGQCDQQPFTDMRDLDDRFGGILEVLTTNGKYFWVPYARLSKLRFLEIRMPVDLLWRPISFSPREGPDGNGYVPCLYPGSSSSADQLVKLGRSTAWEDQNGPPVSGLGHRQLLIGEDAHPLAEIKQIDFAAAPTSAS